MKKLRVYVAGPITGTPEYRENFENKSNKMKAAGFDVLNPIACDYDHVFSYMDWILHGLFLLSRADFIYLMKGWEKSKGARLEKAFAECMGIDIICETTV